MTVARRPLVEVTFVCGELSCQSNRYPPAKSESEAGSTACDSSRAAR